MSRTEEKAIAFVPARFILLLVCSVVTKYGKWAVVTVTFCSSAVVRWCIYIAVKALFSVFEL